MSQETILRSMLADPQFAGLRPKLQAELDRIERRKALAAARRQDLASFPFKVRVRLEAKDRAMNTWHSWNVEANTAPGNTWEVIGNTGDTSQGWSAHYHTRDGESVALATRWSVKDTKHEAVLLIAQEHAARRQP
jgi:hypothetical protein